MAKYVTLSIRTSSANRLHCPHELSFLFSILLLLQQEDACKVEGNISSNSKCTMEWNTFSFFSIFQFSTWPSLILWAPQHHHTATARQVQREKKFTTAKAVTDDHKCKRRNELQSNWSCKNEKDPKTHAIESTPPLPGPISIDFPARRHLSLRHWQLTMKLHQRSRSALWYT